MTPSQGRSQVRTGVLLVLFFFSGAAALIYEVLWLKELGLLFGVTAYAAATTLAVFFLGLSAGSLVWGRRSASIERPLRVYAFLELAIAVSALAYFWLLDLFHWLYPQLFQLFGQSPAAMTLIKFALAVGILFLPAFFMGGTLPVMGQYLVRSPKELGRKASALYAINTFGAALGALAAGFFLPRFLGFSASYAVAIGLNVLVFGFAFWWSRGEAPRASESPVDAAETGPITRPESLLSPGMVWLLAFASGFLTLALEVLWTRMFSQVLQNSVYTFAAILTVFLIALACGSLLANLLCRRAARPERSLFWILLASALAVFLTPAAFYRLTSGQEQLGSQLGWAQYALAVFGATAAVLLVPGLLVGSVFPYLMKISEGRMQSAGRTIGQLAAVNTAAAILGSLAAGFWLLNWLGLWASLGWVALAYVMLATAVLWHPFRAGWRWPIMLPMLMVAFFASPIVDYGDLGKVGLEDDEELIWLREGSHGTVAVIGRGEDLRLKVNNHYTLGSAASTLNQRVQAWIALALHPEPRSVFFLGMGTGITAGGALDFPVERLVVAELNPDVVEAARRYFEPYLNGLFHDPRVEIMAEDGRAYLAGTTESFDVVIGDVFLTHRAGVGSLYTVEHFRSVKSRLAPGGLFVQWLPFFELSAQEFGIIVRTMSEVFPQVTLWRRSTSPRFPVFALVGAIEPEPLDPAAVSLALGRLTESGDVSPDVWFVNIPFATYAGNMSRAIGEFQRYQVSTDDRRPLEYLAPVREREIKGAGRREALNWEALAVHCARWLEVSDPPSDPFLSRLTAREKDQILAGLEIYRYETSRRMGDEPGAEAALSRYRNLIEGQARGR